MKHKPTIALLTTGGTIAMAAASQSQAATPSHNAASLLTTLPHIAELVHIEPVDLFAKSSTSFNINHLHTLHQAIMDVAPKVDGIIITHGTDVMEETCFALSCLPQVNIPVVVTGALRRADMPGADGPANLADAVRVAIEAESATMGPVMVMNGEIFAGHHVQKKHSFLPRAFAGNAIGYVAEERVRYFVKPNIFPPRTTVGTHAATVLTLECSYCMSANDIEAIDASKIDGLVLNGTGVGHVTETMVAPLSEIAKVKPVVFASRTGAGETFENYYGYAGGETDLIKNGIIPARWLGARQARMLMLLALSNGNTSLADIKALFEQI